MNARRKTGVEPGYFQFEYELMNESTGMLWARRSHWPLIGLMNELQPECASALLQPPQITKRVLPSGRPIVEVRVYDPQAVNWDRDDMRGNFDEAMLVCEEALENVGYTIAEGIRGWEAHFPG